MGRRHRDLQQRRRAAGSAQRASRPVATGGSGLSRYFVDLAVILVIAVILNVVLREVGMVNSLLRILVGLIAGRVIVSLGRRYLDSRD